MSSERVYHKDRVENGELIAKINPEKPAAKNLIVVSFGPYRTESRSVDAGQRSRKLPYKLRSGIARHELPLI